MRKACSVFLLFLFYCCANAWGQCSVDPGPDTTSCVGDQIQLLAIGTPGIGPRDTMKACIWDHNGGNGGPDCTFTDNICPFGVPPGDDYLEDPPSQTSPPLSLPALAYEINSITINCYWSCGGVVTFTFLLNGVNIGDSGPIPQQGCSCSPIPEGTYPMSFQFFGSIVNDNWNFGGSNTITVIGDFQGGTSALVAGYSADIDYNFSLAPRVFSWSPSTGLDFILGENPTATVQDAPVTYTVTFDDGNGCIANNTITVGPDPGPSPLSSVINPTVYSCGQNLSCRNAGDGVIDLQLSGGVGGAPYNVNWAGPSAYTSTDEDPSALDAGTYMATITDAIGCVIYDTVTLTEPLELVVNSITTPTFNDNRNVTCNGAFDGSIDLTVDGGADCSPYSFNWTGPNSYSSGAEDPNGLEGGDYFVTVTDQSGCTTSTSINLNEPDPLVASLSTLMYNCNMNITCNGAADGVISNTTTGGADGVAYNFSWSGPNSYSSSLEDPVGLDGGTYDLTVTDANNCTATSSIVLLEPDSLLTAVTSPTYTDSFNVQCAGDFNGFITMDVTGGADCSPYSYSWTGPNSFVSAIEDPGGLESGMYYVTVQDNNACMKVDSIFLLAPEPITSTVTSPTFDCGFNVSCPTNADGAIDIDAAGGSLVYTYAWDGPGSFTTTQEDPTFLIAGTYNVTITDANMCTGVNSITLTEPDPVDIATLTSPTVTGGWNVACDNSSDGLIFLDAEGGAFCQGYAYMWSGPDGFVSSDKDLSGLAPGSYTVIITDSNGCTGTGNIMLTAPDPITTVIGPMVYSCAYNISCNGGDDGSVNLVVTGGESTNPYFYTWTGPNSFSSTTEDPTGLEAGTYFVTVTDANACTKTDSITLSEPAPLEVVGLASPQYPGGHNVSCNGAADGSASGGGTGGSDCFPYLFSWEGPNGFTSTDTAISGLVAGEYEFSVVDANGCETITSIELTEPDALTPPTINQIGDSLHSLAPGYFYQWTKDGTDIFGAVTQNIETQGTGVYTVVITDQNGCSAESAGFTVVGRNEDIRLVDIRLYPNPSSTGQVILEGTVKGVNELQIEVYSLAGQRIWTSGTVNTANGLRYEMDVTPFSSGVYLAKIQSDSGISTRKFIIQ